MENMVPTLVSTIIPVYNRAHMVHVAVNSVLSQTYRPIEIILVNDGSSDNSAEVLKSIAAGHPEEVRVIQRENGGAGLARESGRLIARGEYIQYLDSDDWLLPNKFDDQVTALYQNPDCDIAYGTTCLVNETGETLRETSKRTGENIQYLFPALLLDRWWHTSTPLYSRRISDIAGPWPKRRPEDWDLEARMGAYRPKLVNCGSKVSCHLDHSGEGRVSRGAKDTYLRDEAWFLPRLYECALRAGISKEQPEMKHLSRWAFMRARQLGAIGEPLLAQQVFALAKSADNEGSLSLRMADVLAGAIGWKLVGKCSTVRERLPF